MGQKLLCFADVVIADKFSLLKRLSPVHVSDVCGKETKFGYFTITKIAVTLTAVWSSNAGAG